MIRNAFTIPACHILLAAGPFIVGAIFPLLLWTNPVLGQTEFFEQAKLFPPSGLPSNGVGRAVHIKDDRAIVGAIGSGSGGSPFDAAYVFERNGQQWNFLQELVAPIVNAPSATFGFSVAIDESTAIVGAHLDGEADFQSGAVFVFDENAGVFSETQKILNPDSTENGNFGYSISKTADKLLVGAPRLTGSAGPPAAYMFTEQPGGCTPQTALTPSTGLGVAGRFGSSVSVDGNFAVVGADGDFSLGLTNAGAAYVFEQIGNSWVEDQQLLAFDAMPVHAFGEAVSISGNTIAVGAPGDDDLGTTAGAVYMYRHDGSLWSLEQKVTALDGLPGDAFGRHLSLRGDILVVGNRSNDEMGNHAGAVYVFEQTGPFWAQTAKLFSSDIETDDKFGTISLDGNQFIVGASGADPFGAAYVFVIPEPSTIVLGLVAISVLVLFGFRQKRCTRNSPLSSGRE